jgi:hypothetical protein
VTSRKLPYDSLAARRFAALKEGQEVEVTVRAKVTFIRPRMPEDRKDIAGVVKVRMELHAARGYVEGQYIETWVPVEDIKVVS